MFLGETFETLAGGPDAILRYAVHVRGHLPENFDLPRRSREPVAIEHDVLPNEEAVIGHASPPGVITVSPCSPAPSCMKACRNLSAPARVGKAWEATILP